MQPFLTKKLEELLRDNAKELQDLSSRPAYVALRVYGRWKQTTELIQGFADCGFTKLTAQETRKVAELRTLSWEVISQDAENPQRVSERCIDLSKELAGLFGVTGGSG